MFGGEVLRFKFCNVLSNRNIDSNIEEGISCRGAWMDCTGILLHTTSVRLRVVNILTLSINILLICRSHVLKIIRVTHASLMLIYFNLQICASAAAEDTDIVEMSSFKAGKHKPTFRNRAISQMYDRALSAHSLQSCLSDCTHVCPTCCCQTRCSSPYLVNIA